MKKTKNTPTRSTLTQPNACARRDTNPAPVAGEDTRLLLHLPQGAFEKIAEQVKRAAPKQKYQAILSFTQHSRAKVIIEAASLAEAEAQAEEIEPDEVDDWDSFDGELYVDSVETLTGGKDDE